MNSPFFILTVILGFGLELFFSHYLSLFGVAPNLLLLFVLSFGFMLGPVTAEVLGFIWGLMADAMGVQLFGLNSFIFTLFGYLAGKLKRRFDAERPVPQMVIACVATVVNAVFATLIFSIAEETEHAVGLGSLMVAVVMNGLLAAGVFWAVDRWIILWRIDREHT